MKIEEKAEVKREGEDVMPWGRELMEEIRGNLTGGEPLVYSDASVKDHRKAVAVWFGTREGGGKIYTKVVEGLPHDSGRGELAGPILALRVLL